MFHIIDDWYLVPDEYCWMLAKYRGVRVKRGKEERVFDNRTFHKTPEDALNELINKCTREACGRVREGELKDLLITISSECKRISDSVSLALAWAKGQQADAARKNSG